MTLSIVLLSFLSIAITAVPDCGCISAELVESNSNTLSDSGVEFSWTSRESPTPSAIHGQMGVSGDHVVIHASTDEPTVTRSELLTGPSNIQWNWLTTPPDGFDPLTDTFTRHDPALHWFSYGGLTSGDVITIAARLVVSWDDCDFMAWSGDQDPDTLSYANNILGSLMTTTTYPEHTSFEWTYASDTIYIAGYTKEAEYTECDLYLMRSSYPAAQSDGRSVSYDTYNFRTNLITPFVYCGYVDDTLVEYTVLPLLSVNNFFSPQISLNPISEVSPNVYNISWTSYDRNQDDLNWFEVTLRSDEYGYQLLVENLTDTYYLWDSHGFPVSDAYQVRITGYSIDLNLYDGPFIDIPDDYEPGHSSYIFSEPFAAGADIPMIATLNEPENMTWYHRSVGNEIVWILTFISGDYVPESLDYLILVNDAIHTSGRQLTSTSRIIRFSMDEFEPGEYNVTLEVQQPRWGIVTDTVFVVILGSGSPLSPMDMGSLIINSVSAISIVVILFFTTLILRHKRKS